MDSFLTYYNHHLLFPLVLVYICKLLKFTKCTSWYLSLSWHRFANVTANPYRD